MTDQKNPTIDVLKGLAIALVVYGHFLQRTMLMTGDNFFSHPVFITIYAFHMPLFFFLSGYLVAYSLRRKSVSDVFKARCQNLLWPYFVWGTMGVLALYLMNARSGDLSSMSFFSDWVSQLLIVPQIWFLWTLFFCSAILLIGVYLEKFIGLAVYPVLWSLLLLLPSKEHYGLFYIVWFSPFYMLGYLISRAGSAFIARLNKISVLLICLAAFVVLVTWWSYEDYIYNNKMAIAYPYALADIVDLIYRYLVGLLGIGLAFFAGSYLSKHAISRREPIGGRFWAFIGGYSLEIYLLQCFLVEGLFQRIWPKTGIALDPYSLMFLAVFAPVLTLLTVGFCIAVAKWLIRSNPVTNMVFLGRKV